MAAYLKLVLFLMVVVVAAHQNESSSSKVVLVLYTGGTIGMQWTEDGYRPAPLSDALFSSALFHNSSHKLNERESNIKKKYKTLLILPIYKGHTTAYHLMQYDEPLDSSNMNMSHWKLIAKDIEKYYSDFDGFVVLHGTDTMAYTASALSFMLENLHKTVVITGSQVPILEVMSDGINNLVGALVLAAGHYPIREVTLYFNHKLFRGNRVTKESTEDFDAFKSHNYPPLVTIGTDVKVAQRLLLSKNEHSNLKIYSNLSENVGVLWLYPGITPVIIRSFLQSPIKGVVLKTFGSGNLPEYLIHEIQSACKERDIIIVSTSQCAVGQVTDKYLGKVLQEAGVVPGADMTTEAALTKLSYVMGRDDLTINERKAILQNDIRGELTESHFKPKSTEEYCSSTSYSENH